MGMTWIFWGRAWFTWSHSSNVLELAAQEVDFAVRNASNATRHIAAFADFRQE